MLKWLQTDFPDLALILSSHCGLHPVFMCSITVNALRVLQLSDEMCCSKILSWLDAGVKWYLFVRTTSSWIANFCLLFVFPTLGQMHEPWRNFEWVHVFTVYLSTFDLCVCFVCVSGIHLVVLPKNDEPNKAVLATCTEQDLIRLAAKDYSPGR